MPKCPPTGGVRLQEVSVSGGSTVLNTDSFEPWPGHCVLFSGNTHNSHGASLHPGV